MRFAPYTVGTELTAIPKDYDEQNYLNHRYEGHVTSVVMPKAFAEVKSKMKTLELPSHCIDIDSHCIEVSSPKFSKFEAYKKWCIAVRGVYKSANCYPQHPETVCGGAHLHVGNISNELKIALAKDMIMRPYLPWVFGQPDEAGAMDVLISRRDWIVDLINKRIHRELGQYPNQYIRGEVWALDALINDPYPLDARFKSEINYQNWELKNTFARNKLKKPPDIITAMDWSKDFMFRMSGYGTVEFRFFEMTPTWEEQEIQVEFAINYINWVKKRQAKGDVTKAHLITSRQLQKIEPDTAAKDFRSLCSEIGIDSKPYNRFIRRNLFPRWRNGRKRQ
jgi:hypothetical protein